MKNKKTSDKLKLASAITETVFAVPLLGGVIIGGLFWLPLLGALALHIVTLRTAKKENKKSTGSIVGIVASTVGIIPVVGWFLHIATAIVLWLDVIKSR